MIEDIIVVTMPSIPGYRITKIMGPISGLTVRTRGFGGKIAAGIEGLFGGEITTYSEECERARKESLARLLQKARKVGANAILSTDFETTDILQGTATVFSAFGTAVILEFIEGSYPIVFETAYTKETLDFESDNIRKKCPSCNAVYSYNISEIKENMVSCQNCGKQIEVSNQ